MKTNRCLYCYQPLEKGDFHEKCCQKFFGTLTPPLLDLDKNNLEKLAEEVVVRSVAITGVQPKLSLTIERIPEDNRKSRLTIVGLWGNFILKPQSTLHELMPENEDLTMHLSEILGINTAEHTLFRTASGEIVYIVKRFDRIGKEKLLCEDLCQLSEVLTEKKYRSSMEKTGKIIKKNVANPLLDAIAFFEIALFSFISGNADMHLKNFSILKDLKGRYNLSPAYDLLNTKLAVPEDQEEMALTVNARKNKIARKDFDALGSNLGMNEKQINQVYDKFSNKLAELFSFIDQSFLTENLAAEYKAILKERSERLGLLK
jgi:serine/threonine-protein kinase HipA